MQNHRFYYNVLKGGLAFMLILATGGMFAQMPTCVPDNAGGLIYFQNGTQIYSWNPTLPFSATNPSLNNIVIPNGAFGLAVSENLNNPAAPSPTFYTSSNTGNGPGVGNATYRYYNGATWVNTGHISGTSNIGGGGGFIFGYVNATGGNINKYAGTGNATAVININDLNNGGPADIQGEIGTNNFYMLKVTAPAWFRKYDENGNLLYQWNVTYGGAQGGGAGLAILNGTLYALTNDGLYSSVIGTTDINLLPVPGAPSSISGAGDMAACSPGVPTPPLSSNDTVYSCSSTPVNISSSGTGAFSYTILNGAPTITGNGPDYSVTTSTLSTVVINANNTTNGTSSKDTFTIVPVPAVNAGMDDTLSGCGTYTGILNATVTNTQPWINYTYNWAPAASIASGGTTLTPGINPAANTTYILSVSTSNEHGNCIISDSVMITVKDESAIADFSYELKRNCTADSVIFTNLSQNAAQYSWDFGDGNVSTSANPTHIYSNNGSYNVKLKTSNGVCQDSVILIMDNTRVLTAGFTTNVDTICEGSTINFTDASTIQLTPGQYNWDFGDGSTSTMASPSHTYLNAGLYQVKLVVSDAVPCYDTMKHIIVVDSIPEIMFDKSADNVCTGIPVYFNASVTQDGLTGLTWDFGDGTLISDAYNLTHAYEEAGTYYINLKARFRACPELNYNDSAIVHPFPKTNIGPDTTICLQGNPIVLANSAPSEATYRYLWNTGDTASVYSVVHPGIYTLTVTNQYGCSTSDDVEVTKDCYIDIPNAFTPNNDGVDDYFLPRQLLSSGVAGFRMQVFNRWGQVVFETNAINGRGWDGKFNGNDQSQGVYIYTMDITFKNARTEKYTGNVTLLR